MKQGGAHQIDLSPHATLQAEIASMQQHIKIALETCKNPGSDALELDGFIRDRATEYHLSSLRANLLRALKFNPDANVLEIGCECGALTQFLGETCQSVLGIENNPEYVELAKLRTRTLGNVEIASASFGDIHLKRKFDVIICMGAFENTSLSADLRSNAEKTLLQLTECLNENGVLLIASDNPSGLARLSSRERNSFEVTLKARQTDTASPGTQHVRSPDKLMALLQPHFSRLDLLLAYPDYRLSECVLSDEMIQQVSAGELLGNFRTCRENTSSDASFNEKLALLELDKKDLLSNFANSCLVIAGKNDNPPVCMDGLGALFSKGRVKELQAVTRFTSNDSGGIKAVKIAKHASPFVAGGTLRLIECETDWSSGYSLQLEMLLQMSQQDISLETLFEPAKTWLDCIRSKATLGNGQQLLDGGFIDHIWKNCFLSNQQCHFIDREWEWSARIPVNTLLVRSIFLFLKDAIELPGTPDFLTGNSTRRIITRIARTLDIELTNRDFSNFCRLEAKFQSLVYGRSAVLNRFEINLILWNRSAYNRLGKLKRVLNRAS